VITVRTRTKIIVRKHCLIATILHGVMFQEIVVFIVPLWEPHTSQTMIVTTTNISSKWQENESKTWNCFLKQFSEASTHTHTAVSYAASRKTSWPGRATTWHWAVKGTHTARHSHPVASLWRPAIFHCHECFLQPTYHVQSPHSTTCTSLRIGALVT
jgi:hypothetical protein